MNIVTRAEWGALPPNSPLTPWNPDNLLGVVVHHFAIPRSATTAAGSDELMRSVQRAHKAGDFIDIAYNFCFDKFGQIFEGRGFGFQTGAHTPLNSTHASICYIGDSDKDGFPEAAQDAAGWLLREWFNRGTGVSVKPHGAIAAEPTGCPGITAKNWVTSGAWKADLPDNRRWEYRLVDKDGKVLDKSAVVGTAGLAVRLAAFATRVSPRVARLAAAGRRPRIVLVRVLT